MLDEAASTLCYVWHAAEKPLTVTLRLDVVHRLGMAVQVGCQAVPRRGLEIGAILLGRIKRRHGETLVEIENFDLLESEHAAGPSYLLSAADRHRLGHRLRQHRSSGQRVVGFCRSHTRRNFDMTIEDSSLLSDYFAQASMVFLLIHAIPGESLHGRYYIWEGRSLHMGRPYEEFPFRSAVLQSGNYELIQRAPSAANRRPGVVTSLVSVPGQVAAVASGWFQRLPRLRTLKRPDLRVLRWTPKLPSGWIPRIQRGLRFSRMVARRHALQWIPAAAVLAATIAGGLLHHESTRAAGSNRHIVSADAGGTVPAPLVALRAVPPIAAVEKPLLTESAERAIEQEPLSVAPPPEPPVAAPKVPRIAKPVSHPSPSNAPAAPPIAATPVRLLNVQKLSAPSHPAMPPSLPEAPQVANALVTPIDPFPESDIVRIEAPKFRDPLVTVSFETLPLSHRAASLARHHPAGAREKQAVYTPPTLAREEPLDLPPELRHRIRRAITINVKLYLDRSGKIEFAELLSDGTGNNRDLASMAVFTSRHCQFLPARLGDEAVPAEVLLHYRFASETHAP